MSLGTWVGMGAWTNGCVHPSCCFLFTVAVDSKEIDHYKSAPDNGFAFFLWPNLLTSALLVQTGNKKGFSSFNLLRTYPKLS